MDNQKASAFFHEHRDELITIWLSCLDWMYPDFYNIDEIKQGILNYFNYIFENNFSEESRQLFDNIPVWCDMFIERNTPFIHIIDSSSIGRNAIFEIIERYDIEGSVSVTAIKRIIAKMGVYDRLVINCYMEQSDSAFKQKDITISELHDDRINLIGKMAASMAHEIRNPLTSIRGFLKLLRSNINVDSLLKVDRYIKIIEDEFENIHMQIIGFLSFSHNRAIEEQTVTITIASLVDSVLSLLTPRLVSEDVELLLDLEEGKFVTIQKVAIQQVISNIINNAVDAMFNNTYPKVLGISLKEDDHYTYLYITNNGPEIPREMKKTLFTPFVTNKEDGTGLGLAICKKIMSLNKGGISFTSNEHETTFIISFKK